MEEPMTIVEPLQDGDGLPTDGLYMIFEFNPHNARLTTIGEYYSSSPYSSELPCVDHLCLDRAPL